MAVGGIYDSYGNGYNMPKIPSFAPGAPKQAGRQDTVTKKEDVSASGGLENAESHIEEKQPGQAGRVADLSNIFLKFNKEETFDYIGNDSSLDNLDMQKAISDMRKDQVLQGYQYFVGSSYNLSEGQQTEDGIVFLKQQSAGTDTEV